MCVADLVEYLKSLFDILRLCLIVSPLYNLFEALYTFVGALESLSGLSIVFWGFV